MSSGVKIGEDVKEKYCSDFKQHKKMSFLILKLNDDKTEIVVDTIGPKVHKIDDQRAVYQEQFVPKLREAEEQRENRFAFFDFLFKDGNETEKSKIVLIHWNPDNAKVKSKMVYAASCQGLLQTLQETKKFQQANAEDEVDYDTISKDLKKKDRA